MPEPIPILPEIAGSVKRNFRFKGFLTFIVLFSPVLRGEEKLSRSVKDPRDIQEIRKIPENTITPPSTTPYFGLWGSSLPCFSPSYLPTRSMIDLHIYTPTLSKEKES